MRYCMLLALFFISLPVSTRYVEAQQAALPMQSILIHNIVLEGFVLEDKDQFVKLFKPYRNKYLTNDDINTILQKIQVIYEKEGYQQLVSISYQVTKHHLVYTALMTS